MMMEAMPTIILRTQYTIQPSLISLRTPSLSLARIFIIRRTEKLNQRRDIGMETPPSRSKYLTDCSRSGEIMIKKAPPRARRLENITVGWLLCNLHFLT